MIRVLEAQKAFSMEAHSQVTENNAGLGDTCTPVIPKQGKWNEFKKSVAKGTKNFGIVGQGPTIHSQGVPTHLHSGLVTHGHVTKGLVTGN